MMGMKLRQLGMTSAAVAVMLAVGGCHKKSAPPPAPLPPPDTSSSLPTASLTADPSAIDLGQSVVLNWRTTNATSVSIEGVGTVNANGTTTVTPSTSTNFHLTATSADGRTADANVRVTVRVPSAPPAPTSNDLGGSDAEFHANVQDVFFDYDSYSLSTDGASAVSKAASYVVAHPGLKLVIGGYCDERGSAEYNLALGENRANAAKQGLIQAGIAADRIRVISYGKEKQFCSEQNEACYQQNRRAQFNIDR